MKKEIEKRIERLETRTKSFDFKDFAVFTTYVTPGHIDRPVAGWSFGDWDDRVKVLREEGETDDALRKRAIALARKHRPGSVPNLSSIVDSL
jgi:hypothetical protein